MKRTLINVVFVASLLAMTSMIAFARQNDAIVGKDGWITLNKNTMFAGVLLKPGYYLVTDETSGANHRITLMRAGDPDLALQYSDKAFEGDAVSESCSMQAAPGIFKKTKIVTVADGATQRITQVEIKGENVVHVF